MFENGITQLVTWQFIIFCLAISAMLKVAAMIVDYFFAKAKFYHLWTELILPIAPVFLGSALGRCMTTYPFPEGFNSNNSRLFYGMVAGLLSSMVYRLIRKSIQIKIEASDDSATAPVAPVSPVAPVAPVDPVVPAVNSK